MGFFNVRNTLMTHNELLIKGGHVVDPAAGIDDRADIYIKDGTVKAISRDIQPGNTVKVIDARHRHVIPGLIDCHTHLREPGLEYKEDIRTGSRAAAAGGYTTLICEPNTLPPIDSLEMVELLMERVRQKSIVNIYTKACITRKLLGEELTDIDKLATDKRVRALSDDGNPVYYESIMEKACELSAKNNLIISPHCEDSQSFLDKAKKNARVTHFPGKAFCHETDFIIREIRCTEQAGGRLHVSHISFKSSADVIQQARKRRRAEITCEVTPHHLVLDNCCKDLEDNPPNVNPPLRSPEDKESMQNNLVNGTIDVIATDHAPHTNEEKKKGAPGFVGLETALGIILTKFVHPGILSLKDVVLKMSANPARIFRIDGGSLAVGMPANIAIIDLNKEWTVDAEAFHSKGKNSPFLGWKLLGKATTTIVGGKVVLDNGQITW
ncbi:MAG: dihydroorotase [Candidatus Brocadiaceae bacterium]|nr:dihydroorotase [Candidatus Brocadiaceae bacterium]